MAQKNISADVFSGSQFSADIQANFSELYGYVPSNQSLVNFRNLLDGGDFTVNPWQRNIAAFATANVLTAAITGTTPTYFPDRWFAVGSATCSILMAQVADSTIPGFSQACKVSRSATDTHTAVISFGQVMETADAYRAQGQTVTFSFWAKLGANYSGGAVTVQLISGTSNNDTAAHMMSTSWSGQVNVINASQLFTTGWVRYQFTGVVPAAATQLGVLFSWTPTGTAGADDSISFQGLQLEVGSIASPFEHRDVQVELEICQRYCWVVPEPATGVIVGIGGAVATANNQVYYMATPVQLYKAPTVTLGAGSFKSAAAAPAAAATGLAAGTTHTPNAISVTTTLTETVGLSASLQGGGGSGYIMASSDF